jgi:putative protease
VILRELSLEEIEIRQVPDMELKDLRSRRCALTYCRCLLSGYINKRDQTRLLYQCLQLGIQRAEGKEDVVGNIVHKYEPIPVQNVDPRWVLAHQQTKSL